MVSWPSDKGGQRNAAIRPPVRKLADRGKDSATGGKALKKKGERNSLSSINRYKYCRACTTNIVQRKSLFYWCYFICLHFLKLTQVCFQ
jgi:hypothetical protein